MKKIYFIILTSCLLYVSSFAQTVIPPANELVLPQFAYQGGTSAAQRVQYVCRLKLTGLLANTTYKYFVGMSSVSTQTTTAAGYLIHIKNSSVSAGNIVGIGATKGFGATASELDGNTVSFGGTQYYLSFTTDTNGEYTGWFASAPINNTTQQALGSDVYFFVQTNNGGTGTGIVNTFRTTNTIKLLDFGTTAGSSSELTSIIGATTGIGNEKFVSLYDNVGLSGRPLYTTWTEDDGMNVSTTFAGWYSSIDGISGAWGAVIPNNLPTGVRGIQYLNIDGTSAGAARTSANGTFGVVSTVNPAGGTTPINLDPSVLPITLTGFTGVAKDFGVTLNWTTSTEINNQYFEVLRASDNGEFTVIGNLNGAINSSESKNYTFTDYNPLNGNNYYTLKQVDLDGKSTSFGPIVVKFGLSNDVFKLLNSSEVSVSINISSSEEKQAEIAYIGLDGRILHKQSIILQNGLNTVVIPVDKSTGNIGIISYKSGAEQKSLKISR